MFEDTGLTVLDLDQYPQYALKNIMVNFDGVDIQKDNNTGTGQG